MGASHPSHSSGLQSDFVTKIKLIRERLESRESETLGKWMTLDALRKSGEFSSGEIKNIKSYCEKFPESLCRLHWGWGCLYPGKYPHVPYIHACVSISRIACSYIPMLQVLAIQWQSDRVLCHHWRSHHAQEVWHHTWSWGNRVPRSLVSESCLHDAIWYMSKLSSPTGAMLQIPFQAKRTTTMHQDSLYMTCSWKNHPCI